MNAACAGVKRYVVAHDDERLPVQKRVTAGDVFKVCAFKFFDYLIAFQFCDFCKVLRKLACNNVILAVCGNECVVERGV